MKKEKRKRGWWTKNEVQKMNELRISENLTFSEVGRRYSISGPWVCKLLKKFEIPVGGKSAAQNIKLEQYVRRMNVSKKNIIDLYIDQALSAKNIVAKLNISTYAFYKILKIYGIPNRQSAKYRKPKNYRRPTLLTSDLLYKMYIEEKLTAREIAARLDYSSSTVTHNLSKSGISANQRSREESRLE